MLENNMAPEDILKCAASAALILTLPTRSIQNIIATAVGSGLKKHSVSVGKDELEDIIKR